MGTSPKHSSLVSCVSHHRLASRQTYGYPFLYALSNLEAVGLLKKREKGWVGTPDSGSPWPALRRSLRLVNDAVDVRAPEDIAYVSSGYACACPTVVRNLRLLRLVLRIVNIHTFISMCISPRRGQFLDLICVALPVRFLSFVDVWSGLTLLLSLPSCALSGVP